jgi:predicted amidohydrolase
MKLSLVQFEPDERTAANVETAATFVAEAASDGADLVVLPEIWNVGYFAFDAYEAEAEPVDGPTATRMSALAADHGVHLHAGSIVERDEDGSLYNTSLLFDADGNRLDVYRKMHLFGYESEESKLLTPGERVVTVETELGTVGMTTCYDLRFPELYRALRDAGADLFLVTSAWPQARLDHWRLLTRTRAVEDQVFLAAANLTGTNGGVELGGNSVVVDPWGTPRANAGQDEGVTTVDVDLDAVERIRGEFPALADRQIDLDYRY